MGKVKKYLIAIGLVVAFFLALFLLIGAIVFIINCVTKTPVTKFQIVSFSLIVLCSMVCAWYMIDSKK